ncbi:histone-lysine N-methyltransferase PR-Set7-like [Leptopilina boulardi]|uniref:histone-lysine N-methyltransferase PR-Set7-like n=1 Tax=Leptopilina boulardi TaxID=63433 RepID=UPI0021F5BA2B|nr:histone-lysine N-methyltransferase PR-Set7-like [Leptopilina boulardi]
MLYPKNGPKPLEAEDGEKIHGPPTPHRIKLSSEQEETTTRSKQVIPEKKKKTTTGCALSPVQFSEEKKQKPVTRKRRKQNTTNTTTTTTIIKKVSADTNHKLTEYYTVRRSVRKCKTTVLEEKQRDLESKIISGCEDGLEVRTFAGKGRGIVTTREFTKGEFVVEYIGDLIDQVAAKKRENQYAQDQNTGCYMYYFQHRNQQYCVDATAESDKLGRLVNHSRNGNLITRIVEVKSIPHLVLIAKDDIAQGVEVTYDYGDRSKESIRYHPWLAL